MNIAFIGFGNMARAIAAGFQRSPQDNIYAAAPSLANEVNEDNIITHPHNLAVISHADMIILAVKPSHAIEVLNEIGLHLPEKALLLSVVAGLDTAKIAHFCRPKQAIVRCMPNLPIAVAAGATPLFANPSVNAEQKLATERLFSHSSLTCWLDKEDLMNPFTALSGSGPAYVFLFIEALIQGAGHLGIESKIAKDFAIQTLLGSLHLLQTKNSNPAELRKQVTSLRGTTAAALTVLQEKGFTRIMGEAMRAACDRAQELGNLTKIADN